MRIPALRNLGPKSAAWLSEIGIETRADLEECGPVQAFLQVEAKHPRGISLVFLWALWGALHDQDWRDITEETKAELRAAVAAEEVAI